MQMVMPRPYAGRLHGIALPDKSCDPAEMICLHVSSEGLTVGHMCGTGDGTW